MLEVTSLNKRFMPYVSRAKTLGGPTLVQAIGPALLVNSWLDSSCEIRDVLVERFGKEIAYSAADRALQEFLLGKDDLRAVIEERFKEIYD